MPHGGCLLLLGMGTTCYCKCPIAVILQVSRASGKEGGGDRGRQRRVGVMLDEGYSVF